MRLVGLENSAERDCNCENLFEIYIFFIGKYKGYTHYN